MTQNFGDKTTPNVRWADLFPAEFKSRLTECPIVYLPYGLCEPHGQISAFGLDTIKAEWLCEEAARRVGGMVAPTMGYHIHETGYHARWLEETVGEENPHMTAMPPDVMLRFFLYQLRTFVNAGFQGIVVISGHSGGNQYDLRLVAARFSAKTGVSVFVASDTELVEDHYTGDHAGKYEISQLMFLRPDLIDMSLANLADKPGAGGRFALGDDYAEASPQHGRAIMVTISDALCEKACMMANRLVSGHDDYISVKKIGYEEVEEIWKELREESAKWRTASPWEGQKPVSPASQWKNYEFFTSES